MPSRIQIEICVDSLQSVFAAAGGGAHRLELCQNLFEGGTTPSYGLLRLTLRATDLPVFVMIRPRGADFCYSDEEFGVMQEDLHMARELGADGIVTGILKADGSIDVRRMRKLMDLAGPVPVTFHRAFDVTSDPRRSLETLVDLGVARVLTSGQERSVLEGADLIAELVKRAGKRIIVVPGGGITERNFVKIQKLTNAVEFHLSASAPVESRMKHRNTRVPMGRELRASEFGWTAADPRRIASLVQLAS
ncbi:MAG: copper homeostasis protein CutC [Verrucomicrobia bacterium]|nr:copper homeostasis protein CutC [Verrucomicrobiota bacterium]